ncbi:hypothetical protein ACLKA6_006764 [Drosophila palustris]
MDVVDGLAAPLGQIATATTFAGLFGLLVLTALGFCHRHLWLFNVAAATGHRGKWQVLRQFLKLKWLCSNYVTNAVGVATHTFPVC